MIVDEARASDHVDYRRFSGYNAEPRIQFYYLILMHELSSMTQSSVRACVHAYVLACVRACVRAYEHACVRTCMRACVRVLEALKWKKR